MLQFLVRHGSSIDEQAVEAGLVDRVDLSSLSRSDLASMEGGRRVRPGRWGEYILDRDREDARDGSLWGALPPVMPYAILDPRVIDLALGFAADPDGSLNRGYRRLEDTIRRRIGSPESGAKLFSKAFSGAAPLLTWKVADPSEKQGRANLFNAVFMAFRNPRAHREEAGGDQLAEFLLLNQLFRLEADAVAAEPPTPA